jgi:threonine-phosphate decarboxylase
MTPIDTYSHGGDMDRVARQTGIPAENFLDFSANVNPMGLPARAAERLARDSRDSRLLSRYPSPEAPELRSVLSRQLGVPAESIVVGAGADALIHATVRAMNPRICFIPIPAFSEYERACRACGCMVRKIPLRDDFSIDRHSLELAGPRDIVILNNPHNPSGACMSRDEMLDLIASVRSSGAAVLADEAFIDYAPGAAITCEAANKSGVIAIRSLTKFFGCAGLRVGYAVAAPETAREVAMQLPAWPVTTLALNALSDALQDSDYIRESIERNQIARSNLSSALARLGCRVFPSEANFLLLRLPEGFKASEVRERLIQKHTILVRECEAFEGIEREGIEREGIEREGIECEGIERGCYVRVAVRLEAENARLIEALANVLQDSSCHQDHR